MRKATLQDSLAGLSDNLHLKETIACLVVSFLSDLCMPCVVSFALLSSTCLVVLFFLYLFCFAFPLFWVFLFSFFGIAQIGLFFQTMKPLPCVQC